MATDAVLSDIRDMVQRLDSAGELDRRLRQSLDVAGDIRMIERILDASEVRCGVP